MIVRSFETINGNRKLIAEGDIPDEQAKQLEVDGIIRLVRVIAHSQQIGSRPETNTIRLLDIHKALIYAYSFRN